MGRECYTLRKLFLQCTGLFVLLSVDISGKMEALYRNAVCYRLSDSKENHSLLEEMQIELRMELFRKNSNV
jgi:hypothetical protein